MSLQIEGLLPITSSPPTSEQRFIRKLTSLISLVAVSQGDLPSKVLVLTHDEITGKKFGTFVKVEYLDKSGSAHITLDSESPVNLANYLTELDPEAVLILDRKLLSDIFKEPVKRINDSHFRINGVTGRPIEVYTL